MLLDPVRSVTDFSFYKEVPRKSFGSTVGYLAFLGVIFALALAVALFIHVRPRIVEAVDWAAANVPKMTLAGGKLTSELPGPTIIRHPKAEVAAIMIDTNRVDAVSAAEMDKAKIIGYLTQNAVYVRTPDRMETYDISKAASPQPVVIDSNFFKTLGAVMNRVLYPIAFLTGWVFFLAWKHISSLLYSLVALLINGFSSGGLEYPALYRIAVYAQTPVIILQIVALFLPRAIPLFGILAIVITSAYIWKGIRSQAAAPGQMENL